MKCIQYYRPYGGNIVRITDEEAAVAVNQGIAKYIPKKIWKEKVRDAD